MLGSSRITTRPIARRSPAFVAAAWPKGWLVQMTSTGRPPIRFGRWTVPGQQRPLLLGTRRVGDNDDLRPVDGEGAQAGQGPFHVGWLVAREQDDRG